MQLALSYEQIANFTNDLEVRRDLGNRTSPAVSRAHVKRLLKKGKMTSGQLNHKIYIIIIIIIIIIIKYLYSNYTFQCIYI